MQCYGFLLLFCAYQIQIHILIKIMSIHKFQKKKKNPLMLYSNSSMEIISDVLHHDTFGCFQKLGFHNTKPISLPSFKRKRLGFNHFMSGFLWDFNSLWVYIVSEAVTFNSYIFFTFYHYCHHSIWLKKSQAD